MVNLSAGKNSTDIALAVDAIDLAIAERPEVVVLVASDSDFAPLVIRLREKGCRVCGIGQQGKTGDETQPVYDDFIDLPARPRPSGEGCRRPPARARAGRSRAPRAGAAPARPGSPPCRATSRVAGRGARAARRAQACELGSPPSHCARRRCSRNAPSTKLFRKYPERFALTRATAEQGALPGRCGG